MAWLDSIAIDRTHTRTLVCFSSPPHSTTQSLTTLTHSASRQNVRTSLISQYLGRFNSLRADEVDPLLAHCLGTWEGVVHNLELDASAMQCGAPRETLLN